MFGIDRLMNPTKDEEMIVEGKGGAPVAESMVLYGLGVGGGLGASKIGAGGDLRFTVLESFPSFAEAMAMIAAFGRRADGAMGTGVALRLSLGDIDGAVWARLKFRS